LDPSKDWKIVELILFCMKLSNQPIFTTQLKREKGIKLNLFLQIFTPDGVKMV